MEAQNDVTYATTKATISLTQNKNPVLRVLGLIVLVMQLFETTTCSPKIEYKTLTLHQSYIQCIPQKILLIFETLC